MPTLPGNSLPEKPLLLIVDDDALICDTLSISLSPLFEVLTSHSRPHCLQLLRQLRRAPELALVDLGLAPVPHRPDEGFALIADLLKLAPRIRIVVLSGQSDEGNARHARTLGAADFVAKPCSPGDLQQVLTGALEFRAVDNGRHEGSSPLLGNSPAIQKLHLQLLQYADLPFPVLIEGESGSGKEVIASSCLHYDTSRRYRPFLAINCAAISPNLVEATLFGYSRGAFTGAVTKKAGYFEDAADGTLFLDEIGELALDLQAKLLRVLENGEYQRVGETQKRVSRARIIAATNRDLRKEVKAGNFRADLYHRLSVCSIVAPPLREMGDDRFVLLDHFRQHYAAQTQQQPFSLSAEATELWCSYPFPGNVRELRNIVIRLTTRHSGRLVDATALAAELDLPDEPQEFTVNSPSGADALTSDALIAAAMHRLRQKDPFNLDRLLDATERGYIEAALKLAHGNVSQAARLLGIHRTTLYNRMESSAREQ
ncbi:MAG TPA: sigma-54-dependent Fis family transcriptional regulator [Candidatus Accumulibacter sp.]|uniref:sigma-54-dependent transcriptional regulator n=1 Tax=Accumulibacter sp. TaxID=2053492 RepID=UPI000EE6ABDB|nr:sigma-54 dependent transcriptional regulator [Accumulibacter sp.]MBL8407406.1 sigma-54-dependent Fis family transcriptional regulator [Accumulibacter sp.]HCZ15912.1 sigma-54-dependent Fis family transcriptional regulator [Accumulibacter sp.]HRF11958.1 sigma-54 dependent transcriptional regulator [Candidatus Accumulibacter phosphatis]